MASHISIHLTELLFLLVITSGPKISESIRTFTIINGCKYTIWPGVTPGKGFDDGGFELKPGQAAAYTAPLGWAGRIWGRTGCSFDENGNGTCQTGSCRNTLKCKASGKPPVTLAEFTLAEVDNYDVSLVDGFNLPLVIIPQHGRRNCSVAGCDNDLRTDCPPELAVKVNGKIAGCRSTCEAFGTDEYCCKGVYGAPEKCLPTHYSKTFKKACPAAYSYAYDDPTSLFSCSAADYFVAFCSPRKRPVCSYHHHHHKLVCSRSMSFKLFTRTWWMAIFALPMMINLWIIF